MKKQYLKYFAFPFTLILLSGSASVFGMDSKVYPAFMCLEDGAETGDFNRSMYRITRVNNKGKGILLCPIIRDKVAKPDPLLGGYVQGVSIHVKTFRTDPAPKIRLTLRKFSSTGELLQESTTLPLGGHQNTRLDVRWEGDGYFALEVEMGVNKLNEFAKIFSYQVDEIAD